MNDVIDIWFLNWDEYSRLSNLAERIFYIDWRKYYSVEHCYQCWKWNVFDEQCYLRYNKWWIKIIWNYKCYIKNNWNINLMKRIIEISFENNMQLKEKFLNTSWKFSHIKDKWIWKKEFPKILEELYLKWKTVA